MRVDTKRGSLLSKLSIVIPTYKRPDFLRRQIDFWSGQDCCVVILDGNDQGLDSAVVRRLAENIDYHHLPVGFCARLTTARRLVNTPYTALLADDDLFMPSGLNACLKTLEKDPTLAACQGRAMGFAFDSGSRLKCKEAYPEFQSVKVDADSGINRMLDHFSNYTPVSMYSVARTEYWKRAMGIYGAHEFSVYAMGELQIELSLSYMGRINVVPDLTWLRSAETTSIGGSVGSDVSLNQAKTFRDWWQAEKSSSARRQYLDIFASALAELGRDTDDEIMAGVIEANDAYVQNGNELPGWMAISRVLIKRSLPGKLHNRIREFLEKRGERNVCLVTDREDTDALVRSLNEMHINVQQEELSRWIDFVIGHKRG